MFSSFCGSAIHLVTFWFMSVLQLQGAASKVNDQMKSHLMLQQWRLSPQDVKSHNPHTVHGIEVKLVCASSEIRDHITVYSLKAASQGR